MNLRGRAGQEGNIKIFFAVAGMECLWLLYLIVLLFPRPIETEVCGEDFVWTGLQDPYHTELGIGVPGQNKNAQKNAEDELVLFYGDFALRSGAYEVTVEYESDYDGSQSAENISGYMDIIAEKNGEALKAPRIFLRDGMREHTERIWLRSGGDADDLELHVWYGGTGKLILNRVTIKESVLYRFVRLGGFFLFFAFADILYLCFAGNGIVQVTEETKWKIVCLGLIIFLSSIICFTDFLFDGHDMGFHLERIYRLSESIRSLQIPQRIAFGALNGYGYANSLLYGDAFLYIPAVLYCLWIPLQTCYQLYVIVVNSFTCLTAYWCFKQISRDWRIGIVGSCVYTLSAYRMVNILTRAAVGEYTAMAFFPLVCYGFLRIYQKKRGDDIRLSECMPLIIGLTGVVESHILSTEMVMLFLAAAAVIFWKKTFEKKRFVALVRAAVMTFLINLWFLYPYLCTYFGMEMGVQNLGKNIEKYHAYPVQLFGDFSPTVTALTTEGGMQGEMPLTVGAGLALGIVLYLVCVIKRDSWELKENVHYRQAGIFAVLSAAAMFFSSSLFHSGNLTGRCGIAGILWGALQFPWRMSAMATVFLSFLLVFCLIILREKKGDKLCFAAAVAVLAPGLLSTWMYITDFADAAEEIRVYSYGNETQDPVACEEIAPWFQLKETDNTLTFVRTPLVDTGVCVLSEVSREGGTYAVDCANENGESARIVLPVYHYDHFHAYDKEQGYEFAVSTGENKRIAVELPAGYTGTVLLKYEVPLTFRICEGISFFSFIVLGVFMRRRKRDGYAYIMPCLRLLWGRKG